MIVDVSKLQQIMIFVVLAVAIVAGVKCSDHEVEERVAHGHEDGTGTRIKAQSRISMSKGGYGARIQIREDQHGRKHAHAMAICDCNAQGPWRPLFKPSQILKTEFPEHESFHEEVDSHFRNMESEPVDNHLRSSSDYAGSDGSSGGGASSDVGSISGVSGGAGGPAKKHNHMIHLHLIPHIYVPVMHSGGFSEIKNYHTTVEDGSSSSVQHSPSAVDSSPEFHTGDTGSAGLSGSGGVSENPSALSVTADGDHDQGNFNGHSGESTYYTITEDAVNNNNNNQLQNLNHNQELHDHFGNSIDDIHHHDYEIPSNSAPGEPHQYQVHELDDLSKDYSNKKQVTSSSGSAIKPQYKHRKSATAKPSRTKHGRKLSNRQDLKNLLVMRPPPMGQSQTWRYVYHQPQPTAKHQFYQRKMPLPMLHPMPLLKTRTVPLILHIRQRSNK